MKPEMSTSEVAFLALGVSVAMVGMLGLGLLMLKWGVRKWIHRKRNTNQHAYCSTLKMPEIILRAFVITLWFFWIIISTTVLHVISKLVPLSDEKG